MYDCVWDLVTHSSFLHQVGDHDDDADVLLPDHPPEVLSARPQRTLSGDVRPRRLETLQDTSALKSLTISRLQLLSHSERFC